MEEQTKVAEVPEQKPQKPKKDRVSLILTGAGSVHIDGYSLKKGECLEIEAAKAKRFLSTGLFEQK